MPQGHTKITLVEHFKLMWHQAFHEFGLGRDMLLGTCLALATVFLQVWWKLIPDWKQHHIQIMLSLVLPYLVILVPHVIYRIVMAPLKAYREQAKNYEAALTEATSARDKALARIEQERQLHGGPELSFSWRGRSLAGGATGRTLYLENTGPQDAYDVRIKDVGLNIERCGARFRPIAKCEKGSVAELEFDLFGPNIPVNHRDEFEMVVYASGEDFRMDADNHAYVEFPIDVTFKEYGGARYEAHFLFNADPYLARVNIHLISRNRLPPPT